MLRTNIKVINVYRCEQHFKGLIKYLIFFFSRTLKRRKKTKTLDSVQTLPVKTTMIKSVRVKVMSQAVPICDTLTLSSLNLPLST